MDRLWIFETVNSVYHIRGGVVIAVRSLSETEFKRWHLAIGFRLMCVFEIDAKGRMIPKDGPPEEGNALYFVGADPMGEIPLVITSRIVRIEYKLVSTLLFGESSAVASA
jgi:hypothetical protein